jgi:hypothetical protein
MGFNRAKLYMKFDGPEAERKIAERLLWRAKYRESYSSDRQNEIGL